MHARLLAAYRLLQIRKIDKLIRLTPRGIQTRRSGRQTWLALSRVMGITLDSNLRAPH